MLPADRRKNHRLCGKAEAVVFGVSGSAFDGGVQLGNVHDVDLAVAGDGQGTVVAEGTADIVTAGTFNKDITSTGFRGRAEMMVDISEKMRYNYHTMWDSAFSPADKE